MKQHGPAVSLGASCMECCSEPLLSGVIGTQLPGARGVLQNLELAFRQPCLIGDVITIYVSVAAFHESVNTLVLKVLIKKQDGTTLATGSIRSGLG